MDGVWTLVRQFLWYIWNLIHLVLGIQKIRRILWSRTTIIDSIHDPVTNPLLSVNFHFTRACNYSCGFCFHTSKTSYLTPLKEAKRGLMLLAEAGMRKINFSGGEPFLHPAHLGEMIKFSKVILGVESVTIVSNGSRIRRSWFDGYGQWVDILCVSVDSFNEMTNIQIGRGKGKHLEQLLRVAGWCKEWGIKLKLNTVVNSLNKFEDFRPFIRQLDPVRWKVFQVLIVGTENDGEEGALRDGRKFRVTSEGFSGFCSRHKGLRSSRGEEIFVPESNELMKSSYVILDEFMRFLNKGDEYAESESILEVGVEVAMRGIDFEPQAFIQRGGIYEWSREGGKRSCEVKVPKPIEELF